jgi:hypothetical protein
MATMNDVLSSRQARAKAHLQLGLHLLALSSLSLLTTLPAWANGYVAGHDFRAHLKWSIQFANQVAAGELYPRWMEAANGALGSASFFFYFPLPYWFNTILSLLIPTGPVAILGLSSTVACLASGITAYLWLRSRCVPGAALAGAVIYLLLPYHLLDLNERFAFGELWSFVWIPLLAWSAERAPSSNRAFAAVAAAYAALILTHLPTALLASAIPLIQVLLSERAGNWRRGGLTIASMGLGMGVAAIYLLPALTTQQYASFAASSTGFFDFNSHFVFHPLRPGSDRTSDFWAMLTSASTATGALLLALTACVTLRGGAALRSALPLLTLGLLALAMMSTVSRPIWEALPFIKTIQFPWRFNILLVPAVASLFATLWTIRSSDWRSHAALVAASSATLALLLPQLYPVAKHTYWNLHRTPFVDPAWLIAQVSPPEHRPRWVPAEDFETLEQNEASGRHVPIPAVRIVEGQGMVSMSRVGLHTWTIDIETTGPANVVIGKYYYPIWQAKLDGTETEIAIAPNDGGLVTLSTPPGKHRLRLSKIALIQEKVGLVLTLVSLVLLGFAWTRPALASRSLW